MLGVVFLLSQFSPIEIKVFNKNFLYPNEDIDQYCSIFKSCFTSTYFFKAWWFENGQISYVMN